MTPTTTTAATSPPNPTSSTPGRLHCVAGTFGADYDEGFDTSAVTHHLKKGQGKPAYSLFEGVADDGTTAAQLLEAHGIIDIDVVGLATDYCVRASALDAIEHGRRCARLHRSRRGGTSRLQREGAG